MSLLPVCMAGYTGQLLFLTHMGVSELTQYHCSSSACSYINHCLTSAPRHVLQLTIFNL